MDPDATIDRMHAAMMGVLDGDVDPRIERLHADMIKAQSEFIGGSSVAYHELYSHADDVTIFGGFGGHEKGWSSVGPRLAWAAAQFQPGVSFDYTPISAVFGTDVGCTVWLEHGTGSTVTGTKELQDLRVTHVYRLESDRWRIVHRHADPLLHRAGPGERLA